MILGKENQTLLGHITDCLFAMNARIRLDESVLETVCVERLKADWREVLACLRYIAVMHDIGKGTEVWQEEQRQRIRTQSDHSLITHALPSAFITAHTLHLTAFSRVDTPKHAATLAILGHHGQLHSGSADYSDPRRGGLRRIGLLVEGWNQLTELATQASGFNLKHYPSVDVEHKTFTLDRMAKEFTDWKSNLPRGHSSLRFKGLYCLMSALLRNCDATASIFAHGKPSKENPGDAFFTNASEIHRLHDWSEIKQADVLHGRPPYRLQHRADELDDLCGLLNAGCGEGKTALALLHAQRLMKQGKINRIIFTLPTKFTSNNMYRDFHEQYKLREGLVGIFHGDSRLFLKREMVDAERVMSDEEDEKNNLILTDLQSQDRVYHRPVTISTVDHLLMSFYHGYKYADWAFGNILQSLVIFDELHHYETVTISAINEALKVMRLLRIPHLIMTATIPGVRIATFNIRAPGDPQEQYTALVSDGQEEEAPVEGQELRIKRAFFFRKRNEQMVWAVRENGQTHCEVARSLLKDVPKHQHLRQIIFTNQVEKAKAIAKAISNLGGLSADCTVICYHAEFVGKDRDEKERQIRAAFEKGKTNPCILVATQIAELSLDISADRMYTEIAPLDDIAQRGGRLHRNGVTPYMIDGQPYEMVVYALNFDDKYDVLPYVKLEKHKAIFPDRPHLLQRSWEILPEDAEYSFDNVSNWVNALYSEIDPLESINFRDAIRQDTVFGFKPQDRYSERGEEDGGQVVLRAREYETFDVVPACFEGDLTESSDNNRDFLLKINEFKFWKAYREGLIKSTTKSLRLYKRRDGEWEYSSRTYRILLRPYTPNYGVDFTGEAEFPEDDQPVRIPGNVGL